MSKKSNKKRGFTLIELIIVIAIIAILAAIAVPAFGKIRQNANVSTDMGNARTIYSLVAAEVADENIILPPSQKYYSLDKIGEGIVAPQNPSTFSDSDVKYSKEPKNIINSLGTDVKVKAYQNYKFFVGLNSDGDIQIVVSTDLAQVNNDLASAQKPATIKSYVVYPQSTGVYQK